MDLTGFVARTGTALGGLFAMAALLAAPAHAQTGTQGPALRDLSGPDPVLYGDPGTDVYEVHLRAMVDADRRDAFDAEYKGKTISVGDAYRQHSQSYGFRSISPEVTRNMGSAWIGVNVSRFPGYGLINTVLVVCNNPRMSAQDARLAAERSRPDAHGVIHDIAARVSGRIRTRETSALYGVMVIWLENHCKISFDVPELTQEAIKTAPAVTLGSSAYAGLKELQEHRQWRLKLYGDRAWAPLFQDRKIDMNELMFLEYVLAGPGEIRVRREGDGEEFVFRNYWTPTRINKVTDEQYGPTQKLRDLIRENKDAIALHAELEKFWQPDAIDMAGMITWYRKDWIVHRELTTAFLGAKLAPFVKESTASTAYAPIRGAISRAYASINTLEGEDNAEARRLLYNAVRNAERRQDDGAKPLPAFLYNWVQPKS